MEKLTTVISVKPFYVLKIIISSTKVARLAFACCNLTVA